MSTRKKNLAIYSNLPSGGALELAQQNFKYLKDRVAITYLSDSNVRPRHLLIYLLITIIKLPGIHKKLANSVSEKCGVLLAYHSWMTKSPYILRYFNGRKIYICHEPLREYVDRGHIAQQSIKEKLINLIRLPIKYIDKANLRSENTLVVVNSLYSKANIDKYYKVVSTVLYPGVDTSIYSHNRKVKKLNQIISVGSINRLKGYEFLVKVLSKIPIVYRPTLVVVGNGGDPRYISRILLLAKKLSVKLVVKTNISRSALVREYQQSKIFIYAPVNEPFGVVVLEAMSTGLPLLVSNEGGGYTEIISKQNGVIMSNLNIENWAKSCTDLLIDNNLMARFGNYNALYVRKFYTSDIMNGKLWKLLSRP